jgi:hypothetical protein
MLNAGTDEGWNMLDRAMEHVGCAIAGDGDGDGDLIPEGEVVMML